MDVPFDYYCYFCFCRILKLKVMFTDLEKQKIQSKLGNLKCPICGKTDMFYTDVPTHVISFPTTESGIDFTKVSYMNCLCVKCLNCGYVMQFHLDNLLK